MDDIQTRARALCHRLNAPDCTCEDVQKCESGMAIMEALSAQGGGTVEVSTAAIEAAHRAYERHGQRGDGRNARLSDDCMRAVLSAALSSPAPQPRVGREELREAIRRKLISAYGHAFAPVVDSLTDMALPASAGEVRDYQSIAAKQGTIIIRLRLALQVARAWGVNSQGFHADIAFEVTKWIDSGMNEPLPYFKGPFFDSWAKQHGLSNCDGKLGYRLTGVLTSTPPSEGKP